MKRLKTPTRVSWAPDVELCQVKWFSAGDSPSEVSQKNSDHLLSSHKTSDLPPGFESVRNIQSVKLDALVMAKIGWKSPPKLVLSGTWRVAAGEESLQIIAQKQRELGLLEAIYPRLSVIPDSPFVSSEVKEEVWNDRLTPIVPLTPIEEDSSLKGTLRMEELDFLSGVSQAIQGLSRFPDASIHRNTVIRDRASDPLAAASAVMASVMSKEQSSLIDTDLLVKIFKDPETIRRLISSTSTTTATSLPVDASKHNRDYPEGIHLASPAESAANDKIYESGRQPVLDSGMISFTNSVPASTSQHPFLPDGTLQVPFVDSKPLRTPLQHYNTLVPDMNPSLPTPKRQDSDHLFTKPNSLPQPSSTSVATHNYSAPKSPSYTMEINSHSPSLLNGVTHGRTNLKDVNYIKNLIRAHGEDNQEKQPEFRNNHSKHMQSSHREVKPCAYYMTATGCRNGSKCPFQHLIPSQWQTGNETRTSNPKRMKFVGEIVGK